MMNLLFVGSLTPQVIPYLTDIILFSLAIVYLRDKKILLILSALTFMVVIKAVISGDFLVWRYLLPMLRPFIVVGIILSLLKYRSLNDGYKLRFWLLLTVFSTSAINIIGYIDRESYILINNFWNGDARLLGDTGMNVASIAAKQQRYSSIFAQPATAGLAYFSMLYALMISKKHLPMWVFLLAVIAALFSGFSSKSSFFSAALLMYILFNIIFRLLPMYSKSIVFMLAMAAPTLLTYFLFYFGISEVKLFGDDILGSRFQESSYLYRLISLLDWTDYVFGVDGFEKSGARIGDNAILMRVALAGVFFHLTYLSFLTFLVLKLITLLIPKKYFSSILSFYAVVGFGELGFTSFSQPGVVFLIFLPIILIYAQSLGSPPASLKSKLLSSYRSKSCAAS